MFLLFFEYSSMEAWVAAGERVEECGDPTEVGDCDSLVKFAGCPPIGLALAETGGGGVFFGLVSSPSPPVISAEGGMGNLTDVSSRLSASWLVLGSRSAGVG